MTFYVTRFDSNAQYKNFNQFSCNLAVIDKFVKSNLKKQVNQGVCVAYTVLEAATVKGELDRFVGFYTLANYSIPLDRLTNLALGNLPRIIPCVRLIMLGVNQEDKGNGLGKALLLHAFDTTKSLAKSSGCFGMYLDADPGALPVYLKLGFELLEGDKSPSPSPMFLPISKM